MKLNNKFFGIIFAVIFTCFMPSAKLLLAQNEGQHNQHLKKDIPLHFFAVHCEPTTANERIFNKGLSDFVKLADKYNIKLTIEFTPQWAKMILADNLKLALLRSWQKEGHEIAGHHHPVEHRGTWDGYTSRKDVVDDPRYLGTMDDYIKILNKLVYPGKIYTMGNPAEGDWVKGIPYRTEGFQGNAAISVPTPTIINGTTVYELGYGYLGGRQQLQKLKEIYKATKGEKVFGVVTHAFNFVDTPWLIEEWFRFIKEQDLEGKRNKTVFEIMKQR